MNQTEPCRHRYRVDYLLRLPQPFFRSLPCDLCGRRISLSPLWRAIYLFVDFFGYIFAFGCADSVQIKLFGNTFIFSLIVFIVLYFVLQGLARLVLRYAKWVDADKKQSKA